MVIHNFIGHTCATEVYRVSLSKQCVLAISATIAKLALNWSLFWDVVFILQGEVYKMIRNLGLGD